MSDKAIDKHSDDNNDQEFSLNKFDSGDDKQQSNNVADKQAPIVPGLFEPETDPVPAVEMKADDESDYYLPASPRTERKNIHAEPDFTPSEGFLSAPDEPVRNDSKSKTMFLVAAVAIAIAALFAWLNLAPDGDIADQHHSQAMFSDDSRSQDKVSLLQQRLSSLQAELRSKDKQIAELTHLVSERTLQQQKTVFVKQPNRMKKTPVVNKLRHPIKPTMAPAQLSSGGRWAVIIASVKSRAAAEKALVTLKAKGIAADIHPTTVKGKAWFRLRVSGLASRAEAEIQKTSLAQQHGIRDTWIHKTK